jgi:tetratricopeptide (TPR) repeat protein
MAPTTRALPPEALQQLRGANAALQRGDGAVAEALYRELARRYPDLAEAWHYYGLLLHQKGASEAARDCLSRAERLAPNNFDFLCNHARALLKLEEPAEAWPRLDRAHRLRPHDTQALGLLAEAALALYSGEYLIETLEQALARASDNWELWLLLGDCRAQIGNRTGALAAYTESVLFAPEGEALPYLRRGSTALNSDSPRRDAGARADFEGALKRQPDCGEARLGLAMLAAQTGDFERAEALTREALTRNPKLHSAWTFLASLRKGGDADFEAELARAIAETGESAASAELYFAHGASLEKLARYDEAFAAYARGNRLHGEKLPYRREMQVNVTRNLIEHLDGAFAARAEAVGIPEAGPIFVCGMPRSGTTLIETMLAAHPEVAAGGEMRYIHDRLLARLGHQRMLQLGSWLAEQADAELHALAADWRKALDDTRGDRARVTDKMPGNYANLGFIHVCFPRAAIVHVRRDPRDTCFSCFATLFNETYEFSYALDSLGHYYRLYESLMAHWRRVLGAERIIEVEYEKLVADPETECRRLLAALGLGWDSACLAFHKTRRRVATASLHQVRQPLYSSSVGRWRHFERHLGPLLDALAMRSPFAEA